MKRSLKNLVGFKIKETNGKKGNVVDFLFDEERWIIRYLEVELGTFFNDRKVLIGRTFLDKPEWYDSIFPINISISDIENAPELKEHLPVSIKYEEEFNKHYRIINYWDLPVSAIATMYPPRPIKVPTKDINEKDLNTKLRSFNEVLDYHVHANDGIIGHLNDLIIDDEDWQIVYAVIDTSNWIPWSKIVIIPINRLEEISYVQSEIKVNLSTERIKNSPEYIDCTQIKNEYEKLLYEFYNNK